MTSVILDSGVFIASVYPETFTPQAKALLKQLQNDQVTLHAPHLLTNGATHKERIQRLFDSPYTPHPLNPPLPQGGEGDFCAFFCPSPLVREAAEG